MLYFVAVFAAEFVGFLHPVCWVLAPALGALLAAVPWRWLAVRWHGFGLGTTLAAVFGLLSDLLRLAVKRDGVVYPVLAFGNMANIVYLWTRKAWYLEGAAEECGQAYADAMAPLQNTLWLIIAVAAVIVLAEAGLWIANRIIK